MKSGIYTITNKLNGMIYVGCAINIPIRWSMHKIELKNNKHPNCYLQRVYNKYGKDVFIFEVLVECEEEYLYSEEHWWCNMLNVHNKQYGYNIKPTSPVGRCGKMAEETKKKIGDKHRGRKLSEETIEKMRRRMKGKTPSKETRLKMSESQKNRPPHTEEAKRKISIAHKGRKHSDEMRRKCSERLKGKPGFMTGRKFTPEQLKRLSDSHKGYKRTQESKDKSSKPVIQYGPQGNIIKEWISIGEASKSIGINRSTLTRAANRGTISSYAPKKDREKYQYIWKWKENVKAERLNGNSRHPKYG